MSFISLLQTKFQLPPTEFKIFLKSKDCDFIDKLEIIQAIDTLSIFLQLGFQHKISNLYFKPIFYRWFKVLDVEYIEDIIVIIGGTLTIPLSVFKPILRIFSEYSPDIILKHSIKHQTVLFGILCNRVLSAEVILSASSYHNLMTLAIQYKRYDAITFLNNKITQNFKPVDVPDWVSLELDEKEMDLKYLNPREWDNSCNDDCVFEDNLFKNIKKSFINTYITKNEKGISEVILDGAISTAMGCMDREQIISEFRENKYNLNRLFGPPNNIFGSHCSTSPNGVCRMLTCRCRDFDQDCEDCELIVDTNPNGWFSGSCDFCSLKILDPCYAIRYPIKNGGWDGCFCSMECMTEAPPRDLDELTSSRVDMMTEIIESDGIYDRKWRDNIDRYPEKNDQEKISTVDIKNYLKNTYNISEDFEEELPEF
jgi:hypothetical protein